MSKNPYVQGMPGITKIAQRLQDTLAPSQQSLSKQAVQLGAATVDYAQVLAVNTSASASGNNAPWTASISYQNTTRYSVPWIGTPPQLGTALILLQPPLVWVLGQPSQLASGVFPPQVQWTAVAGGVGFQNSWANFGGSDQLAAYRKVGDVVSLRGEVLGPGGANTTIFTLPAGFRPSLAEFFTVTGNSAFATVNILTSGAVQLGLGSGTSNLSLANINFSVV